MHPRGVTSVDDVQVRGPGWRQTAWRDRMRFRQATFHAMVETLDERGELAESWTVDEAAATLYAVAHFDTWRELVLELAWTDDQYVAAMARLLRRALLED